MNAALLMLIALLGAHCLFDYAGQGDFMAKAKHPHFGAPGVPWRYVMGAHACIHAAAVALITGVWFLFVLEFVAHFAIDKLKCDGDLTFAQDQWAHIGCKVAWWFLAVVWL